MLNYLNLIHDFCPHMSSMNHVNLVLICDPPRTVKPSFLLSEFTPCFNSCELLIQFISYKIDLDFDGVTKMHENIVLLNNEANVSEHWDYNVYALKVSFDLGNDLCILSAHIKSESR
jgi:hypothetical protein